MAIIAACLFFFLASPAVAKLDLSRASVERLDNGLTLILLEDKTFPVVSIQTTYKTGGKDDPAGRLGLAHFFEHMAFRGSKNFPDTGLVSEIYAVGGEWHGYTWIDSTNYFATTPKENLSLLLDIEADRMARLDIRAEDVEAERGAVLAEMSGYLNDPDSTLFDALIATHFLTHPYRNNTIGYAADVNAISHADLKEFYRRHYAPQNAVIAIVGDFNRDEARKLVEDRFAKIRKDVRPRDPLTAEVPRTGERRVRLSLPSEEKLFKIAYPAPAASSDNFPSFLVLQALIGESGGVNFNQNDWGTPVGRNSPLAKAADDIRSWIIPTAEPYAFVISGSDSAGADELKIERKIQRAFDNLAKGRISDAAIVAAKKRVRDALTFDVDTTEEAAHQLAYFAGIGALDRLFSLEGDVDAVTAQEVTAVAKAYLREDQRTVAWLEPGPPAPQTAAPAAAAATERSGTPVPSSPAEAPVLLGDVGRPPVIFQRSPLSKTTSIKALLYGRFECDGCAVDEIAFDTTTVSASSTPGDFRAAFQRVADAIERARPLDAPPRSNDPLTRLEQVFADYATISPNGPQAQTTAPRPKVQMIAVSGDVDAMAVKDAIAENSAERIADLGNLSGGSAIFSTGDISIQIGAPTAQAAVGYVVVAFGPAATLPTDLALYILSHGYEGRLGKEAISRRGLLYYIDARFRRWIQGVGVVTLAAGVDPDKVDTFRAVMKSEIDRLASEPPTDAEIAEAKRHLLGRKISGAQSNEEITDALIRDWLAVLGPESAEAFAARLEKVSREDVLNAVKALQNGAVVTVRGGGVD